MEGLSEEIEGFRNLRPGWNSYQAPEISGAAIQAALAVVDLVVRRGAPLPSAAPTPLGGVALSWALPEIEAQILVDEESFEYSVARPASPKVLDQGSLSHINEVEDRFVDRYLVGRA